MKEQLSVNRFFYLPISNRIIIEGLKGKSDKQLRKDVFNKLSHALNLDISAETSSPKQSEK